jgi:hypothetical protein
LAQLIPCENCGRKFAPDRLPIHLKSCTKEHPAKRVLEEFKSVQKNKINKNKI